MATSDSDITEIKKRLKENLGKNNELHIFSNLETIYLITGDGKFEFDLSVPECLSLIISLTEVITRCLEITNDDEKNYFENIRNQRLSSKIHEYVHYSIVNILLENYEAKTNNTKH